MAEYLSPATVKEMASVGSLRTMQAVGTVGGFLVEFDIGTERRFMRRKDGKGPRIFKSLDAIGAFAKKLKMKDFDVHLANWEAKKTKGSQQTLV